MISSPPNIQTFPNAIYAHESALMTGTLPHIPGSMASSMRAAALAGLAEGLGRR